jgi:hypothetical protein
MGAHDWEGEVLSKFLMPISAPSAVLLPSQRPLRMCWWWGSEKESPAALQSRETKGNHTLTPWVIQEMPMPNSEENRERWPRWALKAGLGPASLSTVPAFSSAASLCIHSSTHRRVHFYTSPSTDFGSGPVEMKDRGRSCHEGCSHSSEEDRTKA